MQRIIQFLKPMAALSASGFFLTLFVFSTIFLPYHNGIDQSRSPIGQDFLNFWAAPIVAQTEPTVLAYYASYTDALETLYGTAIGDRFWSYPPHLLFLLSPLSHVPYYSALFLWSVGGLLLYFYAIRALLPPKNQTFYTLSAAFSPAILACLLGGQFSLYLASLMLLACRWVNTRPLLAGILLGLLTVKPQFGLLWIFLLPLMGAWRCIASAVVTSLILIAASVAQYGTEIWHLYFTVIGERQWHFMTQPFSEYFYQLFSVSMVSTLIRFGMDGTIAFYIQCAFVCAIVPIALYALKHTQDLYCRSYIIMSATLLSSPYLISYDLVFISIFVVMAYYQAQGRARLFYYVAYLIPIVVASSWISALLNSVILYLLFFQAIRLSGVKLPLLHPR